MKNFGKYLLADNLRAAIAALACALLAFILPTGFIAVVVAGLVTLQKGYKSGLMVLAFVLLPVIAFLVTHHMDFFYRFGLLLIQCGLIFIFVFNIASHGFMAVGGKISRNVGYFGGGHGSYYFSRY